MEAIKIEGRAAKQLVTGAAAAATDPLELGIYHVWADVDTFIKIDDVDADTVTVDTGYLVRADTTVAVYVPDATRIGAIAAGAGTLSYHRVE